MQGGDRTDTMEGPRDIDIMLEWAFNIFLYCIDNKKIFSY